MACVLFVVTGCGRTDYSGQHSDLYTEAINTLPWVNGFSSTADRYCEPLIEVLETDSFGRTIFTYYEHYYLDGPISVSSLLVCQFSDDNTVYYYEDVNFIMKEEKTYSIRNDGFTEEDINKLKKANDWNMEINFDNCIGKQIAKSKEKLKYESEIKTCVIDSLSDATENQKISLRELTYDSTGSKVLVYGCVKSEPKIYFIGLVEYDSDCVKNFYCFIPSNIYDIQNELIDFKIDCGWYEEYE